MPESSSDDVSELLKRSEKLREESDELAKRFATITAKITAPEKAAADLALKKALKEGNRPR